MGSYRLQLPREIMIGVFMKLIGKVTIIFFKCQPVKSYIYTAKKMVFIKNIKSLLPNICCRNMLSIIYILVYEFFLREKE